MKKLLKKSLAVLLALLCTMNFAVISFAEDEGAAELSGTCGENLTWEFDKATGTLTISGEGKMDDYTSAFDTPWEEIRYDIKSIVLPDGLTGIGARAFAFCSVSGSVYIPAGVSYIGERAFWSCDTLRSIDVDSQNETYVSENGILFNKNKTEIICYPAGKTDAKYEIPQSVSVIGDYAFDGCFYLKEISIPDGVTSIGEEAFSNCEQLRSIAIPDSVTSIGTAAFESCDGLVTASVGNGVTSIPERMFAGSSVKEVTMCEGVTEIGKEAFGDCDQLKTVNIPLSVSRIGENAFYCNNLSEARYPGTKEQWSLIDISGDIYRLDKAIVYECNSENANYGSGKCGDNLEWILYADGDFVITGTGDMYDYDYSNSPWEACEEKVKTVSLPDGLTGIGDHAFYHFLNVTDITIPESVTRIGNAAFALCLFLTEINIPENVTSIGEKAFYYCIRLKSVTISDGVKSIAPDAFSMCYSLEEITVDPENTAYFTDEKGVLYDTEQTVALAFPIKGITDYTIPASVEYLDLTNLLYAKELRNLFVEEGNASYSSDANGVLYDKDKTEILLYPINNQTVKYTVPNTVTEWYTFAGLKNLEEIVIPSGVDDDFFFLFCENLKTITIGADVDYIQSLGFAGCKSLEKIVVSEDNPNYSTDENGVLYNKDKTELLYVPAKSFEDTFEIPDTVVTVDSDAFIDCENFTLIIPETTTDIIESTACLSVKEFIVSEDHPSLKAIDGVLYLCETDENGNEITYLLKYPVCSDRKDFFVPENVVIAYPNAFYSHTSYAHYPTNLGVEPDESRMFYKAPEDLTLHFSSLTEEVLLDYGFGLKGPKSIYLCDVKTEDMSPEMLVDYINTYRDDQYKELEEGLEEKLKGYDIQAAEFYRQLYKEEREIIPDFRLCDGEHSKLHSYTEAVTKEATCKTEGVVTYTCSCGDTYTDVIPKKAHSWGKWSVITAPTNKLEGLQQRTCSACGETENGTIPVNGYSLGEETYSFENYIDLHWDTWHPELVSGHCFGMSVTSSAYYLDLLNVSDVGITDCSGLNGVNRNAAKSNICKYQVIQGSYANNAIVAGGRYEKSNYSSGAINRELDWREVINYVKDGSHNNKGDLQVAYYYGKLKSGHAVNFIDYRVVNGQERIYVYDNNFPNDANVYFYFENGMIYSYADGTTEEVSSISLHDIRLYMQNAKGYTPSKTLFAKEGQIRVSDAKEYRMLGATEDSAVWCMYEIEDGVTSVTITPLTEDAVFVYMDEGYTFDGMGTGLLKLSTTEDADKSNEVWNPVFRIKSVVVNDVTLDYKNSAVIETFVDADEGVKYTKSYVSSNTKVATVDENGNITTHGRGSATVTCTVTDEYGNTVTDTCEVTVKYTPWQWIIVILLFGWFWY